MNPDKVKMVICVRKDLNMRKGKMVSQGSHSATKVFFDRIENMATLESDGFMKIKIIPEMIPWIKGAFTKVTVGVETEEELYALADKAKAANIPYSVIIDNGFTEFHGNRTTTCIAIGPYLSDEIDKITGGLSLL